MEDNVPTDLVDAQGVPQFGMFRSPFRRVNLYDARVSGWPGPLARLRCKAWQHVAVVTPEIALTLAIVDAGYLSTAWVQHIDRASGTRVEVHRQGAVWTRLSDGLWDEVSRARSPGLSVLVHNHLEVGAHRIRIDATTSAGPLSVRLHCHALPEISQPWVVCLPVGRGRAMYSHKAAHPVEGSIVLNGRQVEVRQESAAAIFDIHKAHYPRETWWNWATFFGVGPAGRLAANFTANVVVDPSLHENVAWHEGRATPLAAPTFDFEDEDRWTVCCEAGTNLVFRPQGERREDLSTGVLMSRFRQRYGTFSGVLAVDGRLMEVGDSFGLMEDHRARW
jgi:hypothetical protein